MEFNHIGGPEGSGLKVSVVGLGCNNFGRRLDPERSRAVVHAALDAGITFFDTAESYGNGASEEAIGEALGARRADVVVATKFGWAGGGSARYIARAVEASLKRLRTDTIDLYQFHKPDPRIPIAETLEALDRLVRDGKVRFIGCSNFTGARLEEALAVSRDRGLASFVTAQNHYSLLERDIEDDLVPVCRAHGIGILPFYPLAHGLLTGKYRRGEPPPPGTRIGSGGGRAGGVMTDANLAVLEKLEEFAERSGHSVLDLAFSWLAAQPCIASVIAGATSREQIEQNVRAAGWTLSEAERGEIDRLTRR